MELVFDNYVTENKSEFIAEVKAIASDLGFDPNWLMLAMFRESTLNHRIINGIGAGGLIQFTNTTAKRLGTTVEYLVSLSNVAQLAWVKKYLIMVMNDTNKLFRRYEDLYLAIFLPTAMGQPDNYTIAQKYYNGNAGMDLDGDGKISIADIRNWLLRGLSDSTKNLLKKK